MGPILAEISKLWLTVAVFVVVVVVFGGWGWGGGRKRMGWRGGLLGKAVQFFEKKEKE